MSGEALHKPLVFSGVQPTGNAHIGNYLGAIKNWVPMQKKMPCLFCVVDMHAITVWMDPKELAHNTREVVSAYIAAGIDPKSRSSSPRAALALMPSSPGYSIALRGSAGSIA
jgi:tryptophanyl-tRNA synthetase